MARSVAVMAACGQLHLLVPVKTVAALFLGFCSPASFHLQPSDQSTFGQSVSCSLDQPACAIYLRLEPGHRHRCLRCDLWLSESKINLKCCQTSLYPLQLGLGGGEG